MHKRNLDDALKNYARGGAFYRGVRHRVFHKITELRHDNPAPLPAFLRDKLLTIDNTSWTALAFDEKDWQAIERILIDRSGVYNAHYTQLVLDYISANSDRVKSMYEYCGKISNAVIEENVELLMDTINKFDEEDKQSLFFFRITAAQYSISAESLEKYLKNALKTGWAKNRFLYPLMYQALNSPSETHLDNFLSYVITGHERESEKIALKFLLRDDLSTDLSIGVKAYIALSCHPYDACEQLLNHIELSLCQCAPDQEELISLLRSVAEMVPSLRAGSLLNVFANRSIGFSCTPSAKNIMEDYGYDESTAGFIAKCVSTTAKSTDEVAPDIPKPLAVLRSMRAKDYPSPDEFDFSTHYARSWWFCDGGRLISALLTTLYMVPRRDSAYEIRDVLRLTGFMNQLLPYLIASPSGTSLLQEKFKNLWAWSNSSEVEASVDAAIADPAVYSDRMWIKAVHWKIREYKKRMQMARWLKEIRYSFKIKPAYLSGVGWDWVQSVIDQVRLRPFINNPSGLFVLLLQKVEEQDQRSDMLRTAAECFAENKTLEEFVEWLVQEYDEQAVAFVRYLLMPDDILLLGLAPNKTAALAGRIYSLQRCVKTFGYSDVLSQELFKKEWDSLNSTLLLMSVNSGQFEIPWNMFETTVAAKHLDLYTTAHALKSTENIPSILSEATVIVPYQFRNGKVQEYRYPNKLSPMSSFVFAIIDDFLEHPSFGLEVLLSTRFRHDTMRREFASVISETASSIVPSIGSRTLKSIATEIEIPILNDVDNWLDRYMHSNRPERPDGMFNVIPDQKELMDIVENVDADSSIADIISFVSRWIYRRLEQQLPAARAKFESMMIASFNTRIQQEKARLLSLNTYRPQDVDFGLVAFQAGLVRRTTELMTWFDCNPDTERISLTFKELKSAADSLFEAYKDKKKFTSYLNENGVDNREILPDKVRLCFDILREVFSNALKHTGRYRPRVRMLFIKSEGGSGFRFSNLTSKKDTSCHSIEGHPYHSLDDVIFREGDSGLVKIASMSATMYGAVVSTVVHQRKHSFHLDVMFWPTADG